MISRKAKKGGGAVIMVNNKNVAEANSGFERLIELLPATSNDFKGSEFPQPAASAYIGKKADADQVPAVGPLSYTAEAEDQPTSPEGDLDMHHRSGRKPFLGVQAAAAHA